jgi:hypothetical protein
MKRWDSVLHGKDGKYWRCRESIAEDARDCGDERCFGALVLEKADYQKLVLERPHFTAKTITEGTQMARQAVEAGKA